MSQKAPKESALALARNQGDVTDKFGAATATLENDLPALTAYVTLSRAALTLARERGTSAERLAEISAALDEAQRPPSTV